MAQAPAVSRVVSDGGQLYAEISVFVGAFEEDRVRGPPRRGRQEALKDCIELRKVAVKCASDPSLFALRQRVRELKDTTWTVKDLGGRQLDGAEGPPPGFVFPRIAAVDVSSTTSQRSQEEPGRSVQSKYRGVVKGKEASSDCIVEVADLRQAVGGLADNWAARGEMLLRKALARFGPVVEVHVFDGEESGADVPTARVRFANAKAAETAMAKATQGFLPLQGDKPAVRLRQPASAEAVWRKFPARRRDTDARIDEAPRKKLRPNERFATKLPSTDQLPDESEAFWEAQREFRGAAAQVPPSALPPEQPSLQPEAPPAPEKPMPDPLPEDASDEDRQVFHGAESVAAEMARILDAPFSQQRKALKKLRMQWHPDKNPERASVATRVFQFIQSHDAWLAHHDLA